MCIIDYGKEIAINILEKTYNTVELDDEDVKIIDNVEMQVISKDTQYWVTCYYVGDYTSDSSDTYSIRVYDNYESLKSTLSEDEIADMYLFSDGSSIADEGLRLEDKQVEEAIMKVLFGKDGIIIPF